MDIARQTVAVAAVGDWCG